jgi:hypothetical protein
MELIALLLPTFVVFVVLRPFWMMFGRFAMLLLGFGYIAVTPVTLTSKKVTSDKKKNTLIVSNSVSWVDILYAATFCTPHILLADTKGNVEVFLPLYAIYHVLSRSRSEFRNRLDKTVTTISPLYMFPESTTSNGKGLLKLVEGVDDVAGTSRVEVRGLSYPSRTFACSFTAQNPVWHLLGMMAQGYNTLDVRTLDAGQSAALLGSTSVKGAKEMDVKGLVERVGRLKSVMIGAEDKVAFMDAYWMR